MPELSELQSTAALWDWVSFIALLFALLGALFPVITTWTSWIKSSWKPRAEKTSMLLAAVGSLFALVATVKLSNINGQIIAILNTQAATARQQAGEAMTKAADAQTRLEEQRQRTAKVEGAVAEAQVQARKFEADIASSNARAEEAKQLAERERLERVKLEAQVAPRRLTPEQQKAIAAALKPFNGSRVGLFTHVYNLEGAILVSQIKQALLEAGIVVHDRTSTVMTIGGGLTALTAGIAVSGPASEQGLVKAIADSLRRDGKLQFVRNGGTDKLVGVFPADGVNLLVGFKPLTPEQK